MSIILSTYFLQSGIINKKFFKQVDSLHDIKMAKKIIGKTNKIYILSGAEGRKNLSCNLIEQKFKLPCLNGGMSDLKLGFHFNFAKKILSQGDIAFIFFNWNIYRYGSKTLSQEKIDNFNNLILTNNLDYLNEVEIKEKIKILSSISFENVIAGFNNLLDDKNKIKVTKELENIENVNFKNDGNNYNHNFKFTRDIMAKGNLEKLDRDVKTKILEFVKWCKAKKIRVVAIFPISVNSNNNKRSIYNDLNKIKYFYSDNNVELINNFEDSILKKHLFRKNSNILKVNGRTVFTNKLIKNAENYFDNKIKKVNSVNNDNKVDLRITTNNSNDFINLHFNKININNINNRHTVQIRNLKDIFYDFSTSILPKDILFYFTIDNNFNPKYPITIMKHKKFHKLLSGTLKTEFFLKSKKPSQVNIFYKATTRNLLDEIDNYEIIQLGRFNVKDRWTKIDIFKKLSNVKEIELHIQLLNDTEYDFTDYFNFTKFNESFDVETLKRM